jgi:hypothetical protein
MSESSDPITEIVASGREVVLGDVEPLWSDLMAGRSTAQETATRARKLMETANAAHVASWGLSSLYAITFRGVPAAEDVSVAHGRWRQHVREYQADPEAWDRRYYQRIIIDFAKRGSGCGLAGDGEPGVGGTPGEDAGELCGGVAAERDDVRHPAGQAGDRGQEPAQRLIRSGEHDDQVAVAVLI